MTKRLESSALAFYELKHQPQDMQYRTANDCAEVDGKSNCNHRRTVDDAATMSSGSSSPGCSVDVRSTEVNTAADTEEEGPVTGSSTPPAVAVSPGDRTTAARPGATLRGGGSGGGGISFSISRILGHDGPCPAAAGRGPQTVRRGLQAGRGPLADQPTTPPGRTRTQSGPASPDSSCRVAGDDLGPRDVTTLNDDVISDEDDEAVRIRLDRHHQSASAIVTGDALRRLSWLQCTRYKPPKLPSKTARPFILMLINS